MPRSSSQAVSGSIEAPYSFIMRATPSIMPRLPATTPAIRSEWPPRYLVAEWITASTPCSAARRLIGVAKVTSAARIAPASSAARRAGSMSNTFKVGLVGSSISTTLVRGRSAARQAATSEGSTKVVSMPRRGSSSVSSTPVAPYRWRLATMWSPASATASRVIAVAAMPLASASAASVPSRAAIFAATDSWFGLLP